MFSILLTQLNKTDILTLEKLKELISNAPINPKPVVQSLDYIHDWKTFVSNWLTTPGLKYQSKYNSFHLNVESMNGEKRVVFRAKKLPQDHELVPRSGIRLIKDNVEFEPVGCAEYRIERLNFDEIMKGVNTYLKKVPETDRREILTSWDRLREG